MNLARTMPCSFLVLIVAGCSTLAPSTAGSRFPANVGSLSTLKVMDLSNFRGNTYFNFITSEKGFKKTLLDPEFSRTFIPANQSNLHRAAQNFDPSVYQKILSQFAQQELGLNQLDEELASQKNLSPANLPKTVTKILEAKGLPTNPQKTTEEAAIVSPFVGLASGSGASVILNRDNYFYSYGSGINFSASPGHKALNATNGFYLSELESLMRNKKDYREFFHSLLLTLLQCDSSEQVRLSVPAQTVLTDFLSLYTAELSRHATSGSMNDLTELTLLSSFSASTGLVAGKKSLQPGHQLQLSTNRIQRRSYQMALQQVVQQMHPQLLAKMETIIGPNSDVIRSVVSFLNTQSNQEKVREVSKTLIEGLTEYLTVLHEESESIVAAGIQNKYAKIISKR